jgi:hypothetical protein
VAIWLLALVATAGAVISIDRVLRNRSAAEDTVTAPVILPPAGGERTANKAVEAATETIAALTGTEEIKRREEPARDDGVPAFDIARVEPSGDTVIAGRAAPGSTVELLRNGRVHDRIVVDASGQFVMPPTRLPVGESELTLRATPRGGAPVVSKQTVVVAVNSNLKEQPVVAVMTPEKPTVVLSKPAPAGPATEAPPPGSVVVETVEAEPVGRKLYVSGHSAPGAMVRLYLNDTYHSTATADANGRVSFTAAAASEGERSGDYRVRLDVVDRLSGVIKSRAEVPFTAPQAVAAAAAPRSGEANAPAAALAAAAPAGDANAAPGAGASAAAAGLRVQKGQVMTVSRGDSLWRISRLAYGDGARYTVIYDANHRQIRNPNKIYPGQIFIIPGKGN